MQCKYVQACNLHNKLSMTHFVALQNHRNIATVIAFYLPSSLAQETTNESFQSRCSLVYNTRWKLRAVFLNAECQAPIFLVHGLTGQGIEPRSTVSVADALFTRPLSTQHWITENILSKCAFLQT